LSSESVCDKGTLKTRALLPFAVSDPNLHSIKHSQKLSGKRSSLRFPRISRFSVSMSRHEIVARGCERSRFGPTFRLESLVGGSTVTLRLSSPSIRRRCSQNRRKIGPKTRRSNSTQTKAHGPLPADDGNKRDARAL